MATVAGVDERWRNDDVLTDRFTLAVDEARRLHADDRRKGSGVPYLGHLLAVTATVLEAGGDEDQAVAAVLHDAAEDHGGRRRLDRLASSFGRRVAAIVEACSDDLPAEGGPKAPWWVRKARFAAGLPSLLDDAVVVVAADKLDNLRSTARDHQVHGEALWSRFNDSIEEAGLTKRDGQLWYYRRVVAALAPRLAAQRHEALAGELERAVADLWDAVVADPASGADDAELAERWARAEAHAEARVVEG